MNTEHLERLELKIAYLEQANQDLSDVVYKQQQEIQQMHAQIAALAARIDSATKPPAPTSPLDA